MIGNISSQILECILVSLVAAFVWLNVTWIHIPELTTLHQLYFNLLVCEKCRILGTLWFWSFLSILISRSKIVIALGFAPANTAPNFYPDQRLWRRRVSRLLPRIQTFTQIKVVAAVHVPLAYTDPNFFPKQRLWWRANTDPNFYPGQRLWRRWV